mmetsp:Transcript_70658/g.111839  ORF Transcript_70658/g.111839 Transcript_70658/m.111839 type:complete len:270 (+) Transcript_70658:635-1444(+)
METTGGDTVVMLVVLFIFKETIVHLQDLVQIKGLDAHDEVHVDLGLGGALDFHRLIDHANPPFHFIQVRLVHEIALVEDDSICEGNLFHSFVLDSFGLLLIQVHNEVLGIHQSHDAIQLHVLLHKVICKEGLSHWCWVCQPGGLNDHAIKSFAVLHRSLHDLLETCNEISTDGATNAAVVHLNDILLHGQGSSFNETVINADLTKLVLNDGEAFSMELMKDVIQKGRFTTTEESSEYCHRDLGITASLFLGCLGCCLSLGDLVLHRGSQ